MIQTYCPNAMMVVMALDDISSLELAEHLLLYLSHSGSIEEKAGILVANMADLVMNREINTGAGNELAVKYNVKYIETSPGKYSIVQLDKFNQYIKMISKLTRMCTSQNNVNGVYVQQTCLNLYN